MKFDATFQAFQLLSRFIEDFLPRGQQLNAAQVNAVHKHADLIAEELTRPQYVYIARYDLSGKYIPREERKPRSP